MNLGSFVNRETNDSILTLKSVQREKPTDVGCCQYVARMRMHCVSERRLNDCSNKCRSMDVRGRVRAVVYGTAASLLQHPESSTLRAKN